MIGANQLASQARIKRIFWAAAACAAGVAVNMLGVRIVGWLNIPLFLDSIGTILIASLGGYIPGIAVGFLTNAINGLSDTTSAYYGVLNVLIAIAAAFFSQKGYYKKFPHILLPVGIFALIGGGIGSLLTWFLFGGGFGTGISAPLAHSFYEKGMSSVFMAQLFADLSIDLADKAVSVLVVALVLLILPQRVKNGLNFYDWLNKKAPRSSRFCRSLSLGTKMLLLIAAAILIISLVVTAISYDQFREAAIDNQIGLANGVVSLASTYIDGNRVEQFIALGEEMEGYSEIKKKLSSIMQSSPDIEFVYVYQIQEDGCHVVFDPDTEDVPGEAPGTVIPFDAAFEPYLPKLLAGEPIDPVISDETYGWLLTVYRPIYDDAGICRCYAAVDISMPRLVSSLDVFLTRIISLFVSFFILVLAISLFLANHKIIFPINKMALAAGNFAYNSEEARREALEKVKTLDIHTGDEIENLYHSFVKTMEDTVGYIDESQKKNERIAKLQNGMIMVLADMVESRDQCTGDHVRKTAAYTQIILEQMKRDGEYPQILTDEYIRDVVNSAPLHDVGKIKISDTVLNKPGKLSEEEFLSMKSHTTIGSQIILQAIDTVSDDETGYLKEAKNMANYHHERWDGKGYPSGLAGENIPLSARVMAVADVFDALVSKRSYKEGFPFEKAMDIIREGAGTHFDPQVVQAFFRARDQVRLVADQYNHKESGQS